MKTIKIDTLIDPNMGYRLKASLEFANGGRPCSYILIAMLDNDGTGNMGQPVICTNMDDPDGYLAEIVKVSKKAGGMVETGR